MHTKIAGGRGLCQALWYGKEGVYEVIVLDHLGVSLGNLIDQLWFDHRKLFLYATQMQGNAQSHCNDLESLAHTIIYLALGDLPWTRNDIGSDKEAILQKKTSITTEELCDSLPVPFCRFVTHVHSLGFNKKLDYEYLHSILSQCLESMANQLVEVLPSNLCSNISADHLPIFTGQVLCSSTRAIAELPWYKYHTPT
ncbi:hypothetical protein BJV74DRAFT_795686 [Russula compacta]|nr:hypothetical protein BJV74DRAFT_795686 [Russula compacta]